MGSEKKNRPQGGFKMALISKAKGKAKHVASSHQLAVRPRFQFLDEVEGRSVVSSAHSNLPKESSPIA